MTTGVDVEAVAKRLQRYVRFGRLITKKCLIQEHNNSTRYVLNKDHSIMLVVKA